MVFLWFFVGTGGSYGTPGKAVGELLAPAVGALAVWLLVAFPTPPLTHCRGRPGLNLWVSQETHGWLVVGFGDDIRDPGFSSNFNKPWRKDPYKPIRKNWNVFKGFDRCSFVRQGFFEKFSTYRVAGRLYFWLIWGLKVFTDLGGKIQMTMFRGPRRQNTGFMSFKV